MEVAGDLIGGWNIKEMLKDRGLAGIKSTVAEIVDQLPVDKQRPQKKKKRPPESLTKTRPPQQKHRRQQKGGQACDRCSDIFDDDDVTNE